MLVKTDKVITPKITKITGIHPAAVERFGYEPADILGIILEMAISADAIIGYNCRRFDKRVLENWIIRTAGESRFNRPWIDLYADLPWTVPVGKLGHVAADHGILNLFPHSALADAQTVLAIAEKYSPELLLDRAVSPVVILRSLEPRSNNTVVKEAKFRWNPERKIWWKSCKQADVEEIMSQIQIKVAVDKELSEDELNN
jgi:hypothetical protein